MTISLRESRAPGEERADHFAQNFCDSRHRQLSPTATGPNLASGRVKSRRYRNPRDHSTLAARQRVPSPICCGVIAADANEVVQKSASGADRIRTCGTSFPVHRFSKPALSTTQPPLLQRPAEVIDPADRIEILADRLRIDKPSESPDRHRLANFSAILGQTTELFRSFASIAPLGHW